LKKKPADGLTGIKDRVSFLAEIGADFILMPKRQRVSAAAISGGAASQPPPFPAFRSFEEIDAAVLSCRLCPLAKLRTRAVPGEGKRNTELMFVGEAPGRDEDIQGKPFVGRAGQLLTKIIEAMKFKRDDVYITNIVKCRPPDNRVPAGEEIQKCTPYLLSQIAFIKPRVIVTLGKTSTDFFIPSSSRQGMGTRRGVFAEFGGIRIMPTFHPAYLIRNEGNRDIKRMVWQDMQQVMEYLGKK
jgi:uracil-DNA glycosylase family 4